MAKNITNITETMKKLRAITEWFESQEEIDVEKGIEKEKIEVIKNAKIKGLGVEIIADIVNLPLKRVQQILDDLDNK